MLTVTFIFVDRHVYNDAELKVDQQVCEKPGELGDTTPDLLRAVKSKVYMEIKRQTRTASKSFFKLIKCSFLLYCLQVMETDNDKASTSDSPLSSSWLSCVDHTSEQNSRALSLHNSITKSMNII